MKVKNLAWILSAGMLLMSLAACGGTEPAPEPAPEETPAEAPAPEAEAPASDFDNTQLINVNSREDGSGTRGAFVELFGVLDAEENDATTLDAAIFNGTSAVMTSVEQDEYAIGYISLGSLNDSVKAVKIDGAEPTVENILSETYKIARPFNVATKGELTEASAATQDFVAFIMSAEGQAIATEEGYIPVVTDAAPFAATAGVEGQVVVAGSTSVAPLIEKMAEAYSAVNPAVSVQVQHTGSSAGMTSAIDGSCDLGMASRGVKDSEIAEGLVPFAIAMDGIAVIVNNENPVEDLSADAVKGIYLGETVTWDAIG